MGIMRWVRSLFAWTYVGQDEAWLYFENSVTGQRRCRWKGGRYAPADYQFIRPGDVIEGPFRREVLSFDNVPALP